MEFSSIQEAMLYPLFGRALYSLNNGNDFKDVEAERILQLLGLESSDLLDYVDDSAQIGCAARALSVDLFLKKYLKNHSNATVVNIGAGFDTTFFRIDNGTVQWYDLDLPEAIKFRRKYILDSDRNISIARSLFDYSWIEDVKFNPKNGILLIAIGVFHYFKEHQMRNLFSRLPSRFPGGELLFDAVTRESQERINKNIKKTRQRGRNFDLEITWHVDKGEDLNEYGDKLEKINEFSFYSIIPRDSKLRMEIKNISFFNSKYKFARFIH
ncbi:MAG: class I SAM-dependent methyltransferase, partial [Candidatus Helarchaeota archaeon]